MSPSLVFKIARREYLARVRSRAFVLMTVFVPAFLGTVPAGGADAGAIEQQGSPDCRPGRRNRARRRGLAERLRAIERPHITVTETSSIEAVDAAARAPFNAAIRDRTLDGYLLLERADAAPARVRYFAREAGNPGAHARAAPGRAVGGDRPPARRHRRRQRRRQTSAAARSGRGGGVGPRRTRGRLRHRAGVDDVAGDAPVHGGADQRPGDGDRHRRGEIVAPDRGHPRRRHRHASSWPAKSSAWSDRA